MKNPTTPRYGFISLFGLVLLAMTVVILIVGFFSFGEFSSFQDNFIYIDAIRILEDNIAKSLFDIHILEQNYRFSMEHEYDPGDTMEQLGTARADFSQQIDTLTSLMAEYPDLFADSQDLVAELNDIVINQHPPVVDRIVAAYQSGSREQAWFVADESDSLMIDARQIQTSLTNNLEARRARSSRQVAEDISTFVQFLTGGMLAVLLLGLTGYWAIFQITQPMPELTNAAIAIGGDQYKPGFLDRLKRSRSRAGALARALDHLAQFSQGRDARRKQQLTELRQELYESRRKRLKITRPQG